jgi:hypothetical protein
MAIDARFHFSGPQSAIGIYFKPFMLIMKDIFKKITYFFICHIRPDERSGQAEKDKNESVRELVAHEYSEPAHRAEV